MPYLWVLLDGNEDSLGQLDVFIADDVQVFLHVAIFPQFVPFTLFNLWKEKKKTKLGTADERSVVWASKSSDFVAVDIVDIADVCGFRSILIRKYQYSPIMSRMVKSCCFC